MTEYETIIASATAAAIEACEAEGPENMNALDCGFAWVTISGKEPLARHCRKRAAALGHVRHNYGSKGYPAGWHWRNPGKFMGQAIGHKLAGARAFQKVLAE